MLATHYNVQQARALMSPGTAAACRQDMFPARQQGTKVRLQLITAEHDNYVWVLLLLDTYWNIAQSDKSCLTARTWEGNRTFRAGLNGS